MPWEKEPAAQSKESYRTHCFFANALNVIAKKKLIKTTDK